MHNSFGEAFQITTWGESHGPAIGVVIDGCPAGIPLGEAEINAALARRRPGQSKLTTQRKESDTVEILSGVFQGRTTGMPIHLQLRNQDVRSKDYSHLEEAFRPGHADYTYQSKYGHRDYRGGGRSSARETANWVAAGAVAQQLLTQELPLVVRAWVASVHTIAAPQPDELPSLQAVDANPVRCPHPETAQQMEAAIREARKNGDTLGGTIRAEVHGLPAGFGEPIFNKLPARMAYAMLTLNATKGFEWGEGFASTQLKGSEFNDIMRAGSAGGLETQTNHAGGTLGGISNGMPLWFRVAFKPVATLMQDQPGLNHAYEPTTIKGRGRHDPCVLPRAVPVVEALCWLVLADFYLLKKLNSPSR